MKKVALKAKSCDIGAWLVKRVRAWFQIDPQWKDGLMPDLQWYHVKLCLIKYEIDISEYPCFCFFILFIFNSGISVKVHFSSSYLEKFKEIHSFWVRKTMLSSTFLIRLRLPGYRCKSGIAIFACKVTGNYAYSPFKAKSFITFKIQVNLPEWDQTGKNKSEVYPLV